MPTLLSLTHTVSPSSFASAPMVILHLFFRKFHPVEDKVAENQVDHIEVGIGHRAFRYFIDKGDLLNVQRIEQLEIVFTIVLRSIFAGCILNLSIWSSAQSSRLLIRFLVWLN